MNKGGLLFGLLAGGYILFELSMLHRLGYRMEADYILDQMVSAQEAVRHCGQSTGAQRGTFQKKLERLVQRAVREQQGAAKTDQPVVTAGSEVATSVDAEAAVAARIVAIRGRMNDLVAEEGCHGQAMATWMRRYTIYAGKG